MIRGLYRDGDGNAKWVFIVPRAPGILEEFKTEATYEALGGQPVYADLPTKAEYEAANAQDSVVTYPVSPV